MSIVAAGKLRVRGWAATSQYPSISLGVRVIVKNVIGSNGTIWYGNWPLDPDYDIANAYRPDVPLVIGAQYGNYHGFDFNVAVPSIGIQTVCLEGQNSGHYYEIGCASVNLSHETDEAGLPLVYTPSRFNRFRYSDPVLRLGYSMTNMGANSTSVNSAMAAWDNLPGGGVRIDTFPETYANSEVDFEQTTFYPGGMTGILGYLDRLHHVNCPEWRFEFGNNILDGYWVSCYTGWAVVRLTPGFTSQSTTAKKFVLMHEFGHALGLHHQGYGTYSVMVNATSGPPAPSTIDQSNIATLYR